MDRLAIFIEPGAPGVVPEASPVFLLLEADHLGDLGTLGGGGLKSPENGGSRRTGTDDGNSLLHIGSLHLIF